ncbi:MAG: hypothetical protein P1U90_20655 [Akkermansiaceae bacterium]|nr:hypothetical protein [Akkermansiaceae bacterium]
METGVWRHTWGRKGVDHVFILEVPIDTALERIGVRDGEANQFEQRDSLEKCHAIFSSLTDSFVQRIDATASPEEVHEAIMAIMSSVS